MATPGENDQQSRKRKKKPAVGKEIGGRWPPIKPKRDLQINRLKGTNLFTIPNFFTGSESKAFVRAAESIGFIHQGSLGPAKGEAYRDNDRISVTDQGLAESIWQSGLKRIFDDIKLQGKVAIGLNPNIRFYRYKVGQRFGRHIDESVDLGGGHITQYTLLRRSLLKREWLYSTFTETNACYMKPVLLQKASNMCCVPMWFLPDASKTCPSGNKLKLSCLYYLL
ncbi:hypothetical protein OPV22_006984 [Ensete ventricosum]|uniref:Prolyl 4-hydroxylase alpha subunit domain-containing protein n=1 Tax=Ensete ventricosum TaxID=4639 RepID=A0AAV8RTT6_ENSVE|nr:hypothetical protein OPV22_006984 [Ensete ventricosum]